MTSGWIYSRLHIDGVDAGQQKQAVFDPLPAVFEIAAAVTVFATQKGATHAA